MERTAIISVDQFKDYAKWKFFFSEKAFSNFKETYKDGELTLDEWNSLWEEVVLLMH
ncbi:MAG: hypothetical protein IKK93_11755 [Campylobacter sp.]|nr:hypothetical protein [Campylobacter sp.]